jgi:predicted phage terminase large subunit-like protein
VLRTLAERSLYHFVRQAWSIVESVEFIDGWHIEAICAHLEAVSRGEIAKLLINIPPGCSKSLLTCVFWPAWEWANNPTLRLFFASYDQRLSTRDSVKCRVLIGSPWYQANWGERFQFTGDQNQKTYYENNRGGYRLATSVGGHGTGEHPDRIVIDDPHDVRGSESEAQRQAVHEWWDLTMSARGVSRAARRVIIMQRLHQDDLSGRVLAQGGFEHICLPMRYEPGRMKPTALGWTDPRRVEGELLCPHQFDEEKVRAIELPLGSYGAAGQLQQRPAPRGGGMFKPEWFTIVDAVPPAGRRVFYWDKAATESGGCYTCGVLMCLGVDNRYYIQDVVRGQWSVRARDEIMLAANRKAWQQWRPFGPVDLWVEQEPGSGGKESADATIDLHRGLPMRAERPSGEKRVRAEPFASMAERRDKVCLLRAPWNRAYLDELSMFPNSTFTDQVDASSGAFNKLATPLVGYAVAGGQRPPVSPQGMGIGWIPPQGMGIGRIPPQGMGIGRILSPFLTHGGSG